MPDSQSDNSPESDSKRLTPAMRQFQKFKQQHPDCILFFRMGDFYELFYDDAKEAHKVMGITLTERTKGVPMAGVPYHSVDGYLRRMIQAGYRVAVCDQTQDPKEASAQGKKVVDRDVSRVVTPGTLTDDALLEEAQENILAAAAFGKKDQVALSWIELSTGIFKVALLEKSELGDELARIAPNELLYCEQDSAKTPIEIGQISEYIHCALTARPAWQFRQSEAEQVLKKQYGVSRLSGFGFEEDDFCLVAAGVIVHYLLETQCRINDKKGVRLTHLRPPKRFVRADNLIIDKTSLRSLEVEKTIRSDSADGSLLNCFSHCVTAMGKRKLRNWLCYPLADISKISKRQQVVQALLDGQSFSNSLRNVLGQIQDVHRIAGRLSVFRVSPRDLVALGNSASQITALAELLKDNPALEEYFDKAQCLKDYLFPLSELLTSACVDSPPAHMRDGGLVRDGYDNILDEARTLEHNSNSWLANYQKNLIKETGISNLKIGFNKVFGYYIEVTKTSSANAPTAWSRKQTLKNAERYITEQLKDFEGKVLSAQARAVTREQEIFDQLCEKARELLDPLHELGELAASLDVLACFACQAQKERYVRPQLVEAPVLEITGGRHPVLSEKLKEKFVPNDITLGAKLPLPLGEGRGAGKSESENKKIISTSTTNSANLPSPSLSRRERNLSGATLAIITGPNMAGKSTYIRQSALITLLAHTGSFVPADSAIIGLCDRIFTRVGASDELHTGQSTFMVEMTETANICHHATEKSLVILDEIGRGTSTLDGLSLAWSIAEYLAARGPRTFFATHYHELVSLAEHFKNITNLNVAVREWKGDVVFLHKIVAGSADKSYGIHVAKLAGLPSQIVNRAQQLLDELEVAHSNSSTASVTNTKPASADNTPEKKQLGLFG